MGDVSTRLEDLTEAERNFIIGFMQRYLRPTSSVNKKHSAYGLKQRFTSRFFYVTQEQFAQAMDEAGFTVYPDGGNGNACFNISSRSPYLTDFDQCVRSSEPS